MGMIPRQLPTTPHTSGNAAGAGILAEIYILLSIATWLVCVRCYGRMRFHNGLGWDDITCVAALVCPSVPCPETILPNQILLIICTILITMNVAIGLGKHAVDLEHPEHTQLLLLKYNTVVQIASVLCTLLTKISISIYILRIKNERSLRMLLWILMVLIFVVSITDIAVISSSCIPFKALWTPSLQPQARCLPLKSVYNVAYVQSGFTIVVDLCLTISPIVVLWKVRIEKWKKVRICVLMSLGLVATISNALRNGFQSGLTAPDPTRKSRYRIRSNASRDTE